MINRFIGHPKNEAPVARFSSLVCLQLLFCDGIGFVIIKLKIEGQTIYRKPHRKVSKLKSKFKLMLGWPNRAT